MSELRQLILRKHQEGKENHQFRKELVDLNVSKKMVKSTLKRFYETGQLTDRKRSGRPRTGRTPSKIKVVRERLRRNPARSIRKLAAELNMSTSTTHRLLHEDLRMRPFKKRKVHGLTEAQKVKRFQRSQVLLDWHADDEIIFSDEKIFLLQESFNPQQHRNWAVSLQDVPTDKKLVTRFQNVVSVMVWGAICKRGKLPLVFIEKGVKVNQQVYLEAVLKAHLLPEALKLFGNDYFCFQQDGAPSHTAKTVQDWCEENLTDFISKDEWPPSSPDLNPLDFCIWSYMQNRLDVKKISTSEGLKKRLMKIWDDIPIEVVRASCESFEKRLKLVRRARGDRIETLC